LCSTDITSLIDTNSTNMKLYFDKINFDTNDSLGDSIKLCFSKYLFMYLFKKVATLALKIKNKLKKK
jgi:hypothetical protein